MRIRLHPRKVLRIHISAVLLVLFICFGRCSFAQSTSNQDCGPPNYCARTDRRIAPYTEAPPALGQAGSIISDPAFGSRILRVTDEKTDPAGKGRSFMTTGSAEQNTWNSDSTRFYALTPSGQLVLFDFDPRAMKVTNHRAVPVDWGDADFSYTRPSILYGSRGRNPAFQEFDSDTGKITRLHVMSDCVTLNPSEYAHSVTVSADDQRFSTILGPRQDENRFVYVFDRKLGCRWYNTQTGETGGQWGPKGPISAPDRFSVHSAKMSKSGQYIWIDRGQSTVGKHWVVWEVATNNVVRCSGNCSGHLAMGYSHLVGPSGEKNPLDFLVRSLNDLSATASVVKDLDPLPNAKYWYSHHLSWNYLNSTDTTPFCLSTFSTFNPVTPGVALNSNSPWENEVLCIEMDGKASRVWRFAHTYSTAKNGFWSTPRGNVSQDGRFYIFTSDWQDTLGHEPLDPAHYRTDVFVVELR